MVPPAELLPLTMPLPAEIATPLAAAPPRPPLETTVQLRPGPALLPVTTERLEPPELVTTAELLL